MPLTNAYRDHLSGLVIGEALAPFSNANAQIGVGNSTTAFLNTQTDLVGASKTRKAMDATYPTRAANALTFRSTFATGDANYTWAEWGVFNAAAAGVMMNRLVEALGTKTSAQTWQITVTVTLTVP
ncbi:MAG: hypothetical protein M3451_12230 [Chloroflexota bacterium]|nr:hypothetical protein [Chloroflexota bacterium]